MVALPREMSLSLSGSIDAFVAAAAVGDIAQGDIDAVHGRIDGPSALEGNLSALHAAAAAGHDTTCLMLLRAGASVNVQDARCWTPLHHAASRGQIAACRVLLLYGASASARGLLHTTSHPPASRAGRVLRFAIQAACGPTPRMCASDPRVRDLLWEAEWRQCFRLRLAPRPLRNWRAECLAAAADEPCCCVSLSWASSVLRRHQAPLGRRRAGYRNTVGRGFAGGLAHAVEDVVEASRTVATGSSATEGNARISTPSSSPKQQDGGSSADANALTPGAAHASGETPRPV